MAARIIEQPSFRQVGDLFIARPLHSVNGSKSIEILEAKGLRMLNYEELQQHSARLAEALGVGKNFYAHVSASRLMLFTVYNQHLVMAENLGDDGAACTVIGVSKTRANAGSVDELSIKRLARSEGLDRSYEHMKKQGE